MLTSRRKSRPGDFREDLLFRLNTIEIHLPPLRERREDLPLLANYFLRQFSQRYRKRLTGFRERRDAGAARVRLAGQCPRAGARRGARGPDGAR